MKENTTTKKRHKQVKQKYIEPKNENTISILDLSITLLIIVIIIITIIVGGI